jgi:hypothetical protein
LLLIGGTGPGDCRLANIFVSKFLIISTGIGFGYTGDPYPVIVNDRIAAIFGQLVSAVFERSQTVWSKAMSCSCPGSMAVLMVLILILGLVY